MRARLRLQSEEPSDVDLALDDAKFAYASAPVADARIERTLALAHLRSGNNALALRFGRDALTHLDLESASLLIMAIAEAKRGNLDKAREHHTQAVAAWPSDLEEKRVMATAERGVLWFETIDELQQLRTQAQTLLNAGSQTSMRD